jgi:hypothetical protein
VSFHGHSSYKGGEGFLILKSEIENISRVPGKCARLTPMVLKLAVKCAVGCKQFLSARGCKPGACFPVRRVCPVGRDLFVPPPGVCSYKPSRRCLM